MTTHTHTHTYTQQSTKPHNTPGLWNGVEFGSKDDGVLVATCALGLVPCALRRRVGGLYIRVLLYPGYFTGL